MSCRRRHCCDPRACVTVYGGPVTVHLLKCANAAVAAEVMSPVIQATGRPIATHLSRSTPYVKVFCCSAAITSSASRYCALACDSPRRLFRISRISHVKMHSGSFILDIIFPCVASRAVTDRLLFRLRSTCLNCRWALLRSLRLQCKSRVPQLCHLRRLFGCISQFST